MKLVIFGANGRTGKLLVEQALAASHAVTAFARMPWRLGIAHAGLTIVQWDPQDAAAIAEAVAGSDAVLSVMGPTRNVPDLAVSQGMERVIAAMKVHAVRRLIVSAGAGVSDPSDMRALLHKVSGAIALLRARHVYADMKRVVELVRASGLEWTIVRVPRLTDQPRQGRLRIGYVGRDMGTTLARADLAAFLLKQLDDQTYLRKAPMISN
jgi:putative NADH-flavin reductase